MNTKLWALIIASSITTTLMADDTEIYGATAIDPANRVNSNVLFIMDTSGSMDGKVYTARDDFDGNKTYSGSYPTSRFFLSLSDGTSSGIPLSSLETSSSTGCDNTVTTLATEGRMVGEQYQQFRSNKWWKPASWTSLRKGNSGDVRCGQGNNYTLYTGNYMNWYYSSSYTVETRLDVVRDVVKDLTRSLSNINLGLMRFSSDSGGGFIDVPIDDISTTGPAIRTMLDSYDANGGTPLEETLYEAALYYGGETWHFGSDSSPRKSHNDSRVKSASGSLTSSYKSAIEATCQKNHVILLTDGEPTSDGEANSKIQNLVKNMSLPAGLSKSCSGNGACLDELAYWLKNSDLSDSLLGSQDVTTYTIGGFDLTNGVELLKRTASWGGGKFYAADNTSELVDALDSIFLDILATDSTFTAPAVSVNAFNASEHRDELFYALFRPNDNAKWQGNLKKYRLGTDGFVLDKDEKIAISESTGFFNEGVTDFWNNSGVPDGKDVTKGGIANLLSSSTRSLYSDETGGTLVSFDSSVNASTLDMVSATADEVNNLKSWIKGIDVDDLDGDGSVTDNRFAIGDPLHSEPIVITYGGTEADPDSTIFFGTNEGFIHAVDTDSGIEEFAFLPQELHKNQKIFYENTTPAGDRPYGMDGPITAWMNDLNGNNVIYKDGSRESSKGITETVYLYAGMRRGGNNYYALDVSDRTNPKLLFKIEGGTGEFQQLGQTWSKMTIGRVMLNGTERVVAFFTGGYDTNQDSNSLPEDDNIGNAIYMVDATTGELLWWVSGNNTNGGLTPNLTITEMKNSIPAHISAVDINGDKILDYFFAADTGGRVFRFDIDKFNTGASDFAIGGQIAHLAGTDAANNRRFYNKPNVSLLKDPTLGDSLTISIGSGHRAAPISNTAVQDRFYVIRDPNPYTVPPLPEGSSSNSSRYASYSKTESSVSLTAATTTTNAHKYVMNATDMLNGNSHSTIEDFYASGGWYIDLPNNGEKVLSESTTFSGAVLFSSFAPSGTTSNSCGADTGTSRIYALNQYSPTSIIDLDGNGTTDADDDGNSDASDTSKVLSHSGIAPRPVVIYRQGGGKTIAIGTENIDDSRFKSHGSGSGEDGGGGGDGDCDDPDGCVSQCEGNTCYVIPMYWRQNKSN